MLYQLDTLNGNYLPTKICSFYGKIELITHPRRVTLHFYHYYYITLVVLRFELKALDLLGTCLLSHAPALFCCS
jgi:hypothetical protein